MMTQDDAQTWILLVEQARGLEVGLCRPEASVARHDDHVRRVTLVDGAHHGNGVDDTAVEHGNAVDISDLREIRQRARRPYDGGHTAEVVLLGEVFGTARQAVGGDHFIDGGIMLVGVVVERHDLVGEALVEDARVEDASLRQEALQRDVAVLLQHIDVGVSGTTGLTAHVRQSVAGTCRHRDDVGEVKLVLHEGIEHPRGEHATHAPTLKNKSCFRSQLHSFCIFFDKSTK